jgi:pyrroloquinoline-quinone synthase
MHSLDQTVSKFHLLNHPFYQRWMAGTLTQPELKAYAVNYYPHVKSFPTYVSATHALADEMKLRQALLENLIEEERGEENHPELWLRFAESLGVKRNEMETDDLVPESRDLVSTFRKLTRKSLASGLGALYAYESQVPSVAHQKIEGLKKNYGMKDERGLKFFEVHKTADEYHSATTREAIDALAEEERKEAHDAAETAAKALWDFLSGLDRAAGKSCCGCAV